MPQTKIFRAGEDVSVITSCTDEQEFLGEFADALGKLMQGEHSARERQLVLGAGYDIVAKLRGYKNSVQERRLLAAGRWPHPLETPIAAGGEADSAP